MSKDTFNYFDAFSKQAAFAQEMALNLASAIQRGELGGKQLLDALHTVENDADQVNHDIQKHLVSDFVVPLERGGMNELANALDDVSDAVEDVAMEAYIRSVERIPDGGMQMVGHLATAASSLVAATNKLGDMNKQHTVIHEHCVKAQSAESDCDAVFIEVARAINLGSDSFEQRHNQVAVIRAIERAMDAVENAAEIIESIVAENA